MTALALAVELLRSSASSAANSAANSAASSVTPAPQALQQGEKAPIAANDRIFLDDKGLARIEFGELEVDLYRSASVQIKDVKQHSSSDMLLHLWQDAGVTKTDLLEAAQSHILLETEYAQLEPEPGAELVVYHADEKLTCMVNLKGTTKLTTGNQTVQLGPGQSRYILEGKPLSRAICVNADQMRVWLDRLRNNQPVEDLGAIVAGWDKNGCLGAPAQTMPPATGAGSAVQTSVGADAATTTTLAVTASAPLSTVIAPSASGMVAIPAGTYVIGEAQPDNNHGGRQAIDLPGFWIDITETTNAQYAKFLAATWRAPPPAWVDGAPPAGEDNNPVEALTFEDAQAYCAWAGKRLPKEAEWEVATRGPGANPPLFPWGNDPTAGGKTFDLPQLAPYPAGTAAFNVSKFGVYDTIGNVWEWTIDPYVPVPDGMHILRGGRHGFLADGAFRQQAAGDNSRFRATSGVRCAADGVGKESAP